MLIRVKNKPRNPNEPLHGGRLTRRQLIGQGLLAGSATLLSGGLLSLFANPRAAYAALASDLNPLGRTPPRTDYSRYTVERDCWRVVSFAVQGGSRKDRTR